METRRKMKLGAADKAILGTGYVLLGLFVLAVLVPLVYVVAASFMDPNVLNSRGISLNIKDWTLDAYRRVLENGMIWRGFLNSFFLFSSIYCNFCFCYFACCISNVKKRICGKKVF